MPMYNGIVNEGLPAWSIYSFFCISVADVFLRDCTLLNLTYPNIQGIYTPARRAILWL